MGGYIVHITCHWSSVTKPYAFAEIIDSIVTDDEPSPTTASTYKRIIPYSESSDDESDKEKLSPKKTKQDLNIIP